MFDRIFLLIKNYELNVLKSRVYKMFCVILIKKMYYFVFIFSVNKKKCDFALTLFGCLQQQNSMLCNKGRKLAISTSVMFAARAKRGLNGREVNIALLSG